MKSDRLKRALQDDTGVLTSAIGWLDEQMSHIEKAALRLETEHEEWLLLKGEARLIRRLQDELGRMGKVKDGTENQSRIGKKRFNV